MKRVCTYALHTVALSLTVCAAALLYGCSNDMDDIIALQQTDDAPVYHISIPVSMGTQTKAIELNGESGINAVFSNEDKLLLYNVTRGAFAYAGLGMNGFGYLHPSDISADGHSATFEGDIKLGYYDNYWHNVTPQDGDIYTIIYNNTGVSGDVQRDLYYTYSYPDNNRSTVSERDYAMATNVSLNLNGNTFSSYHVVLSPIQSVFRQSLSFTDLNGSAVNGIDCSKQDFIVRSKNDALVSTYRPLSENRVYDRDGICVRGSTTESELVMSLMFNYDQNHSADGDKLTVTTIDYDNYCYYEVSKNAPAGGFAPGKYYHGNMNLVQKAVRLVKTDNQEIAAPDAGGNFSLEDGAEYSVSYGSTADIEGKGVTLNFDELAFVHGSLTLDDNGDMEPSIIKVENEARLFGGNENVLTNMSDTEYLLIEGNGSLEDECYLYIYGNMAGDYSFREMIEAYVTGNITGDVDLEYGYVDVTGNIVGNVSISENSMLCVEGNITGEVVMYLGARMSYEGDDSHMTIIPEGGTLNCFEFPWGEKMYSVVDENAGGGGGKIKEVIIAKP